MPHCWLHLGADDIRLDDLPLVLNRSAEYVQRLEYARVVYLTTEARVRIIMKIYKRLGREVAVKVVQVANSEYHGGRTLFDVINATTRAAQYFRPQQQSEVERYASRLLAA